MAEVTHLSDRTSGVDARGKPPPHDASAELALIGAAWMVNDLIPQVFVLPEHFYIEPHRRLWEATLELRGRGLKADAVTVAGWLRDSGRLQQVGWDSLVQAVNAAPYHEHITSYGARIFDLWRLRESMQRCQQSAARGYAGVVDVQKHLDDLVRDVANLAWRSSRATLQGNTEALRAIVDHIKVAQAERLAGTRGKPGLPTGMAAFDRATGGLHALQKVTVASVLGVGKTAWALQASTHIAKSGVGVLWFPELDKAEMLKRQLASASQVDFRHIISESLAPDEWDRVITAMPHIEPLPIMFDDRASRQPPTIAEIRQMTQRAIERCRALFGCPLGLVVVDYVQRIRPAESDRQLQERQQIAKITRGLEAMAQELKIAVIELAQLKIEKDGKGKVSRPTTGSIADCREIEKSSHVVVMLHPEAPPRTIGPLFGGASGKSIAQIVAKNRNGPSPQIDYLDFHGATQTFFDPMMNAASRAYIDGADDQYEEDDDGSIRAFIQK